MCWTSTSALQGDGTTSTVLFTGELLKYADRFIGDGVHPRILVDGFDIAKERVVKFLDTFKVERLEAYEDRELLLNVAKTSLRSKLRPEVCAGLSLRLIFVYSNRGCLRLCVCSLRIN